ncbi:ribbon-helix-helix protein, CopG family [Streptomyces sp. NPDC056144]|uniref:ribbon-helix-helix protein, CopG family n=1 Tax=unclassified Streptomyces TaxID=2593676 RepID=UPI0035E1E9C4
MGSTVLSLRIDSELLDRLKGHAAKRGMSVQDYVVRTLIREDFDERFKTAVEETEKFYGSAAESAAGSAAGTAAGTAAGSAT